MILKTPAHMVLILFVQVLKKVLKSLKFELKNQRMVVSEPIPDMNIGSAHP